MSVFGSVFGRVFGSVFGLTSTVGNLGGVTVRGLGGGGSIFYQVPRRKLSLKERPNDHLEVIMSAAELETKSRALMDPERASPRMVQEVGDLLKPYQNAKQEIDYDAAAQDGHLVRSLSAIWKRYDAKRQEQRRTMRAEGEDLSEYA
jgi:reverse gyrase